jgi:hypothetical protein
MSAGVRVCGTMRRAMAPPDLPPLPPAWRPDEPAFEARVLRAFIKGERLVAIPARERRRLVVWRYLLERVLPDDEPVAERDLNLRIARWHPDAATIRRAWVDLGLVIRAGMTYRRAVPPRAAAGSAPPEAREARERPLV